MSEKTYTFKRIEIYVQEVAAVNEREAWDVIEALDDGEWISLPASSDITLERGEGC